MENKIDLLFELRHKEKKVSDLVRFLNIRCDEIPNYSLLIGAGCSITSGIKSGSQLIDIWQKEIVDSVDDFDDEMDINKYLEKQNWYDERNPYSSLFERRYDLQRQRRAFVENEVSNGNPSIGYAYLVKLIEKNYFNAVFTTNFDDLLNESFYRFSNVRPVVCAHDSAISSITVTSKRPKIIKLHGDYLFEDIKSTLRETESLEGNMKNKFIEFSKDYGLIVVGYAGNDRSIMDILSFLLKKEEFFKNGIYWCIRKGDTQISDDLRKLLWKDRVYFVKIDGFDELMAELNKHLNGGVLPIDNAILSSEHQLELIKSLTSNKYVAQSNSSIIQEDSRKLKKMVSHNIMEDFFKHFSVKKKNENKAKRKIHLTPLKDDERKILSAIQTLMMEDEFDQAYNLLIKQDWGNIEVSEFKLELLEMKLSLLHSKDMENTSEYISTIDALIEINPSKRTYYLDAIDNMPSIDSKLEYSNKVIELYPNDHSLYKIKGDFLLHYFRGLAIKTGGKITADNIIECYNKSIELDGSIFNRAWVDLCDLYSVLYKHDDNLKKEKVLPLLLKYKQQNEFNPNYIEVCFEHRDIIDTDIEKLLFNSYTFAQKVDYPSWVEAILLILIDYFEEKKQIDKIIEYIDKFEAEYIPSSNYMKRKALILSTHFDEIDKAIGILEDIDETDVKRNYFLIDLYSIRGDEEKAKSIVDKYSNIDFDLLIRYKSEFCHYQDVCDLLEKHWETNEIDIDDFVSYSFAKIKLEQYNDLYPKIKQYYDNPDTCIPEIVINYFITDMKRNNLDSQKIKNKVTTKILDQQQKFRDSVVAAAYSLIGENTKALDYLSKAIKKDNKLKYSVREWPAFDNCKKEPRFRKLLGLDS